MIRIKSKLMTWKTCSNKCYDGSGVAPMGQRANLIIVQDGVYKLYYSHWCAKILPVDIFWGPEYAIKFIKSQNRVEPENGWLDDVWAEGGAVIDIDKKVLLFYGGEDILYNIPLRRLYIKILSCVWKNWDIRWAFEGIADLADYVKYPREKVLTTFETEDFCTTFNPPEQKDWLDILASFKFDNENTLIFPLAGNVEDYLENGPIIIKNVDKTIGYHSFNVAEWTSTFIIGGFHIDIPEKTVSLWIARDVPGISSRMNEKWDGWKVNWDLDGFENHIKNSKGRIIFNEPTIENLLDQLTKLLLTEAIDPKEKINRLVDRLESEGREVQVNSMVFSHENIYLDLGLRKKILYRAIRESNI